MLALPLCQKYCAEKLSYLKLGEYLGSGYHGDVFTSTIGPADRVWKLGVVYDMGGSLNQHYASIRHSLNQLIKTQPQAYVRVYQHGYLGQANIKSTYNPMLMQDVLFYYYEMQKLEPLSDDENKCFHTLLSHEDRRVIKDFSPSKINQLLQELKKSLDINEAMVSLFCHRIASCEIKHDDLHERNIMCNRAGEFKLIDVDRCRIPFSIDVLQEELSIA